MFGATKFGVLAANSTTSTPPRVVAGSTIVVTHMNADELGGVQRSYYGS